MGRIISSGPSAIKSVVEYRHSCAEPEPGPLLPVCLLQLVFNNLDVSLIVVILIIVIFVLVMFVIAHCRNMHNIAPHGATAAEALISSSAVDQEGSPKD